MSGVEILITCLVGGTLILALIVFLQELKEKKESEH